MNGPEESDSPIVAVKPANEAARAAEEQARGGIKENADQQTTVRTQSREAVSHAQARIREAVSRCVQALIFLGLLRPQPIAQPHSLHVCLLTRISTRAMGAIPFLPVWSASFYSTKYFSCDPISVSMIAGARSRW
jgi:hypothetical protein